MIKKTLLTLSLLAGLSTNLNADFIGAEAGVAMWIPTLTGDIKKGDTTVDFEDDLGFGSKATNSFFWVYVDHPVPLLPNIKIQRTNYSDDANGKFSKTINFAGINLGAINTNAKTTFTLNQTDLIAYWRILDNWVNLDIGFNLKNIDGNIKIDSTLDTDEDFSATVPMLYAKARFDLPFSGLSIEADLSTISFDGNKITDFKAGLSYDIISGLGAVAGIKTQNIILDDVKDIDADIKISGMYAGLYYHF